MAFQQESHADDGIYNYSVIGDELETSTQFGADPDSSDDEEIDPAGTVHLEILVGDATLKRLTDRTGCEVLRGPMLVKAVDARAAFVEAPDGYEFEIDAMLDE